MKTIVKFSILPALLIVLASTALADGVVIYNTVPGPLPPNNSSLGYEANGIGEYGNLIQFAGGQPYSLTGATVAMSNWVLSSNYTADFGTTIGGVSIADTGFTIPLTLNIYNVGPGNTVGSLIASTTTDAFIPWRAAPDPTDCPADPNNINQQWLAPNGTCYNGQLMTVTLDVTGIDVPSQIIYGLAFNTPHYGVSPTGGGPSASLNFGVTQADPTVGSNPLFGTGYVDASSTPFSYSGQIEFAGNPIPPSAPEPSSLLLLGTGLAGLATGLLRKARSKGLA